MQAKKLEWFPVFQFNTSNNSDEVGGIGFVGDDPYMVLSYKMNLKYDNNSKFGKSLRGLDLTKMDVSKSISEIKAMASVSPNIVSSKPKWTSKQDKRFLTKMVWLHKLSVYNAYFSPGINYMPGQIAKLITKNKILRLAIREGIEHDLRKIIDEAMGNRRRPQ